MDIKNKIKKASAELFYTQGILPTGVDQISDEAEVSKRTLYKYFHSKDEIIMEFLLERDKNWNYWFQTTVEEEFPKPIDRILGMFDVLGEWFASSAFRGCAFLNTMSETADHRTKQFLICRSHKVSMDKIILTWLKEASQRGDLEKKSHQIGLIIDGAITRAHLFNDPLAAKFGKEICKEIMS